MYKLRQLNIKHYNEKNVNVEKYTLRLTDTDISIVVTRGKDGGKVADEGKEGQIYESGN